MTTPDTEVTEPETGAEPIEALPDLTADMLDEMRQGVRRYYALAETEDDQAAKYEALAPLNREEARQYRAKAKALRGLIERLGYDLDDLTVSPADPDGIH
jgi:hypothetical protein